MQPYTSARSIKLGFSMPREMAAVSRFIATTGSPLTHAAAMSESISLNHSVGLSVARSGRMRLIFVAVDADHLHEKRCVHVGR